ncbi:Short-chain dehydrogenase TIC 32, chloroplastic [Daldinia childiae]|uniref:Short-chain dehydrogenase TIC 32, chloroplastic n=1 Tax=Daldinia childiae TaxID=326645 RepID=UPI0014471905|nr:Short-chain dehydrogenase TIC 32, chloroplastic [Daldinia childiae]KAF3069738.1 Short-chain dehydrogenase TIC 32, chloroplastic [Daldinia childiae]
MSPFGFSTTSEELVKAFADKIKGRTFLVTGTTAKGLGAQCAIALARESPAHLILVSRTKAKVDPVLEEIASINPNVKTTFVTCELTDFDSVRAAAEKINNDSSIPKIDVVINNAGIMNVKDYTLDKQGIELTFSADHVGHFLLTNLIINKIIAAAPGARIVNVTSRGYGIGPFRGDDYNFSDGKAYDGWSAYGQAKTSNILYSAELSRRLASKGVKSYAPHPGAIFTTNLANHLDESDFSEIGKVAERNTGKAWGGPSNIKNVSQGAAPLLAAALDPDFDDRPGSYIVDCQIVTPHKYATDPEAARKLWEISEKLVGQKFDF